MKKEFCDLCSNEVLENETKFYFSIEYVGRYLVNTAFFEQALDRKMHVELCKSCGSKMYVQLQQAFQKIKNEEVQK